MPIMAFFRRGTTMNKLNVLKTMRKILILAVLFIILSAHFLFSPLYGHAVWGEKIILTQLNGIKIVGYIYGDEFHRRIETKQGYTMILNEETGTIEYALLENEKLVPSGLVVGVIKPFYLEQINLPKHLSDRKFKIAEIRRTNPERLHDQFKPRHEEKGVKIQALTGTKKVFAVCVEFQTETSPPTGWAAQLLPQASAWLCIIKQIHTINFSQMDTPIQAGLLFPRLLPGIKITTLGGRSL
jgi:hypothetical protein